MEQTANRHVAVEKRPNVATLDFYFDPLCPWAWRASEWIREVQRESDLQVEWKVFSLALNNGLDEDLLIPLRVIMLVRREQGNEAAGRLYEALGRQIHDNGQRVRDAGTARHVIQTALQNAGLPTDYLQRALDDHSTLDQVNQEHRLASEKFGAYGVPWLVAQGRDFGFNGPVIDRVPRGSQALDLWDKISWIITQDYFYELKRNR